MHQMDSILGTPAHRGIIMLNSHTKSPIILSPSSSLLNLSLPLEHPLVLFQASDLLPQTALQCGFDLILNGSSVPLGVRLAVQLDDLVLLFYCRSASFFNQDTTFPFHIK
jgi:hypothetical protein